MMRSPEKVASVVDRIVEKNEALFRLISTPGLTPDEQVQRLHKTIPSSQEVRAMPKCNCHIPSLPECQQVMPGPTPVVRLARACHMHGAKGSPRLWKGRRTAEQSFTAFAWYGASLYARNQRCECPNPPEAASTGGAIHLASECPVHGEKAAPALWGVT